MRFPLIGLALATLGCGSTPAAPVPAPAARVQPAPRPSASTAAAASSGQTSEATQSKQAKLIARMLRRVEAARGLESKKAIPGVSLERAALIAQVKDHVTKELPPEAIRDEGLELALFGFIPTQFDYEAAEYDLLQDQLAGYYEPADGTMYLASDLPDEEADATLAHELVHALQDQRWNLGDRSKYRPGEGDRSEAVSALAEGDATSAMFDVTLARMYPRSGRTAVDIPDDVFAEQIRGGMNEGPSAQAPHVMRTSLVAPYVFGTLFVHALRRQGGWLAVNQAWDNPPSTSEQIMHVDKWATHEAPLQVTAPTFVALGAGWTVADQDSEGELGVRLAFEEWTDAKAAATLSAGWGGDRAVLLTSGDRAAFAWRLRYDPGKTRDERATKAWASLPGALDKLLGRARSTDASFTCHERSDRGPLAVARAGSDLIFVLGPVTTSGGQWASAGDCALARRWTTEIAASP